VNSRGNGVIACCCVTVTLALTDRTVTFVRSSDVFDWPCHGPLGGVHAPSKLEQDDLACSSKLMARM
jgi:hypothetical protein